MNQRQQLLETMTLMEIILSSINTLVLPSFLNNKEKYYKNWLIEINSSADLLIDYQINNTTKVKTITLLSSITPLVTDGKYKI